MYYIFFSQLIISPAVHLCYIITLQVLTTIFCLSAIPCMIGLDTGTEYKLVVCVQRNHKCIMYKFIGLPHFVVLFAMHIAQAKYVCFPNKCTCLELNGRQF